MDFTHTSCGFCGIFSGFGLIICVKNLITKSVAKLNKRLYFEILLHFAGNLREIIDSKKCL